QWRRSSVSAKLPQPSVRWRAHKLSYDAPDALAHTKGDRGAAGKTPPPGVSTETKSLPRGASARPRTGIRNWRVMQAFRTAVSWDRRPDFPAHQSWLGSV